MNDSDLHSLLSQLHERLANASSLRPEDQRLLVTVLADIEKALARNPLAPPADSSGLESLAVKFEADHPALAETLRRVVDSLGKAGI
jgi:hypothetical protein